MNHVLSADEYKNYLLARDYKPSLVDEQFKKISQISREDVSKIKFVTKYNLVLPKIDGIIKKHISMMMIVLVLIKKEIKI